MDRYNSGLEKLMRLMGTGLFLALALLLSALLPASANNMPGPWPVLMIISILLAPAGIVLTAISGGYACIEQRKQLKDGWTVPLIFKIIGTLILVPMILCLVAWVPMALWSLIRSIQLILWGIERKHDVERAAPFLRNSNGDRLLWCGLALLLLTATLLFIQIQMTGYVYSASSLKGVQEQLKSLEQAH